MFHSLSMFLAPETTVAQATLVSPPAPVQPAQLKPGKKRASFKFMACVAGNAIGFGALLTGCWFSLQLMQVILS
jgi:hypothetical protein